MIGCLGAPTSLQPWTLQLLLGYPTVQTYCALRAKIHIFYILSTLILQYCLFVASTGIPGTVFLFRDYWFWLTGSSCSHLLDCHWYLFHLFIDLIVHMPCYFFFILFPSMFLFRKLFSFIFDMWHFDISLKALFFFNIL